MDQKWSIFNLSKKFVDGYGKDHPRENYDFYLDWRK